MQYANWSAMLADYDATEVSSLREILQATEGKTVAATLAQQADDFIAEHKHAVLFTDGTGFAVDYYGGWLGTEVTPGTPAEVTYYTLTKRVR